MKYNTLIVPVVAFAALASALPSSDTSTNARPSDQGKYKARPKTAPAKQQNPVEKLAQQGLQKLPVQPPVQPPMDKLPIDQLSANGVPLDRVSQTMGQTMGNLPVDANGLPIKFPVDKNGNPQAPVDANGLPIRLSVDKNGNPQAPVDGVPQNMNGLPNVVGLLPKLPVAIPPQVSHGMRRSRSHVIRDSTTEISCGHLRVEASDNKYSGFVSGSPDEDGRYTVVKNSSEGTLVDLKGHNLIFRHEDIYPALGGTYGVMRDNNAPQDNLQGNSANFAMLTGTSITMYGKSATSGQSSFNDATGASQHIESAIYYFGENREIHASWINKDGSAIPVEFGVNPDKQVILGANVGQYAATYGGYSAKLFCQ